MKRFKGTVKNDVIVLDNGAHLPDGTRVQIRVQVSSGIQAKKREEAFRRILENPISLPIKMDEIIEEDKKEREAHDADIIGPKL